VKRCVVVRRRRRGCAHTHQLVARNWQLGRPDRPSRANNREFLGGGGGGGGGALREMRGRGGRVRNSPRR